MYVTVESKALGNCLLVFNKNEFELRAGGFLTQEQSMALGEVLVTVKLQESRLFENLPSRIAGVVEKVLQIEERNEKGD